MEWGLCPLTAQGDCPFTAGSHLFPLPPPRAISWSLLLGGFTHLLLPGLLSHSPVSGIIQKACHSEVDSVSRHQGCFPGLHAPPARPLLAQTRKIPSGPEPHGSAWGAHFPLAWSFPHMSPAGSPGAPPDGGRLSALSWGGLRGVRCKKQQVPVPAHPLPPLHSSQRLPPDLLTLGGPRVGSGAPLCVLVLISSQCCPRGSR